MAKLTVVRLVSICLTGVAVVRLQNPATYYSVLISVGLCHYLLSFVYAGKLIPHKIRQYRFWMFAALLIVGLVAYVAPGDTRLRLLMFFWVHHVFNEVYLAERFKVVPALIEMEPIAIAFHSFVYFALLSNDDALNFVNGHLLTAGLTISGIVYFGAIGLSAWKSKRLSNIFDQLAFEILAAGIAGAALAGYCRIYFVDVVFYHFVLWAFVPLISPGRRTWAMVLRYLGGTAVLTGAFLIVSPMGIKPYYFADSLFLRSFYFWSYLHILSSFALSGAQPQWIIRMFRAPIGPSSAALDTD